MSDGSKIRSGRGGRREGAGCRPSTLEGMLKRLPSGKAEKLRREIRREALRLLIDFARAELRQVK